MGDGECMTNRRGGYLRGIRILLCRDFVHVSLSFASIQSAKYLAEACPFVVVVCCMFHNTYTLSHH